MISDIMTAPLTAGSRLMWDALWQAGVIGAAAVLIAAAVGRRRPGPAYGIILLALLKFLIPPLLPAPASLRAGSLFAGHTVAEPSNDAEQRRPSDRLRPATDRSDWPRGAAWDRPPGAAVENDFAGLGEAADEPDAGPAAQNPAAGAANAGATPSWLAALATAYVLGLCAVSGWIAIAWWRVRRLVGDASPPAPPLAALWQQIHRQVKPPRSVRLLLSDAQITPLAFGLLRPVVIFPRGLLETLDGPQQRMVLAHELLHHRRRDPWAIVLELCVMALWWFHPVAWLLIRSSRTWRERCCDAATVRLLDQPAAHYAGALAIVAHWLAGRRTCFTSLSATMHPIGARVHHLLYSRQETRPMKLRTLFSLLAIWALVCLPTLRTGSIGSATSGRTSANDDTSPVAAPQAAADGAALQSNANASNDRDTDRYGDALPPGAIARLGTERLRHPHSVRTVTFSPDGQTIASGGMDAAIRLWNSATGESIRTLRGTVDQFTNGLAFSPDGTKLASTSDRGLVRLWDTRTGEEIWKQQTVEQNIANVAFFPDGTRFATAGGQRGVDSAVRIWNVADGEQTDVFNPPSPMKGTFGLAISLDGSMLACGTMRTIFIYDLAKGDEPLVIDEGHGRDIISLAFTPDGGELISAGQSDRQAKTDDRGRRVLESFSEIRAWNVADGALIREYAGEEKERGSAAVALSADGRTLVSYHFDKLLVWNRSTGERLRTIGMSGPWYGSRSQTLALAPQQTHVALASEGRHDVQLWDWQTGEPHLNFTDTHHRMVRNLAYSPNGNLIATAGTDGEVRLWDAQTRRQIKLLPLSVDHQSMGVRSLAFSPDGRIVAAVGDENSPAGFGGVVTLWQQDGNQVWSQSFAGRGTSLAFSEDGQRIAVARGLGLNMYDGDDDSEPIVSIYTVASGKVERRIDGLHGEVLAMRFSDDGASLWIVDGKMVSTWDSRTGEKLNEFVPAAEIAGGIGHAAFAPGGTVVATSVQELVILSDLTSGEELVRWSIWTTTGNQLAFSADGEFLVTASTRFVMTRPGTDVDVRFWDPSTGGPLAMLNVGADPPSGLALHPDGKQIATGMAEGYTLLWDLSPLDLAGDAAP